MIAERAHGGTHGEQTIELQKHKSHGPAASPSGGIGIGQAPMYSTVDVDESGYESDKTDATGFSDSYLVPFEQDDDEEGEDDEPETGQSHIPPSGQKRWHALIFPLKVRPLVNLFPCEEQHQPDEVPKPISLSLKGRGDISLDIGVVQVLQAVNTRDRECTMRAGLSWNLLDPRNPSGS